MQLPLLLYGKRRWLWMRLIANGIGQTGAAIATVLLMRLTFDHLVHASRPLTPTLLGWIGAGFGGATLVMAGLRVCERLDAERLGQDYVHAVRLRLFDRLRTLSPRVLQQRSHGGILLRFVGDLSALRQWVSRGLPRLIVAGCTTCGALGTLVWMNGWLAFTALVGLLPGLWLSLRLGASLRSRILATRRQRARLANNIHEKLLHLAVVQVYGQFARERRRLARQSRRLQAAILAQTRISAVLRMLPQESTALASAAVLLAGAYEVMAHRTTPGIVVAAMILVRLLRPALRDLGRVHEFWRGAQVARTKITAFLQLATDVHEKRHAPDIQPGPGRLEYLDVTLAPGLQGVTAVAEAGTVVALVGANGTGKSTLLALTARLFDPQSGTIRLDGQKLSRYNLASVRRAVGMVSADLPLLRGSVARNLRYRWPDAPPEAMAQVYNLCQLEALMAELPQGERTRLTEGGGNLSLGQRQRLALARALLGNPAVLLLDEAEANLDAQASAVLDRILATYTGTILMVTHQPHRLAAADVIWHLEDGQIHVGAPYKAAGVKRNTTAALATLSGH